MVKNVMFSQKLLSSELSMAGKKPACGNSSKTDSPSLTQPCVYVAVNFLCQVIFFLRFNFISIHYHIQKQRKK